MFEFVYTKAPLPHIGRILLKRHGKSPQVVPLLWTEHCIECAAPLCYATCPRYLRRADGDCVRIEGGITPVANPDGTVGASLTFRTWAKIESQLKVQALSGATYARLYSLTTVLGQALHAMAAICPWQKLSTLISDGWFSYRQKLINLMVRNRSMPEGVTLQAVVENDDHASALLVDVKSDSQHLYRNKIDLPLGTTTISMAIPPYSDPHELFFINVHPADAERRLRLTMRKLEMVPRQASEGSKIKCVVWDLDNTLWDGVLIEDSDVKLRPQFAHMARQFDSCGIVNSIISKNNSDQAMAKLHQLGLDEYFVFTKINWEPKIVNMSRIIKQMNIGADAIVLVDDNPFERREVQLRHPEVTCIPPEDLEELCHSSRFRMEVTEASKKRRATYRMIEAMQQEEEAWQGDIDDFLRSCRIEAVISTPTQDELPRCHELLQRTNQLNSSGRRLGMEQVKAICADTRYQSYALRSSDRFGDYGLVGFLIVDTAGGVATITDFVISCRVANKKIEPTLINYLAKRYGGELRFNYRQSLKNGPMHGVITELGMEPAGHTADGGDTFVCRHHSDYARVVSLVDKTL